MVIILGEGRYAPYILLVEEAPPRRRLPYGMA
jgi:hypothetical protein